jgi:hypothetical protein
MNHRSNEQFDATALLALPRVAEGRPEEAALKTWSRPFLIDQIRSHGVDVAVTRGAVMIDDELGIAKNAVIPHYDVDGQVTLERLGDQPLDTFDVMRNIVTPKKVDEWLTQLNPYSLRMIGRNKFDVANTFLIPNSAYDRRISFIDADASVATIDEHIAVLPGKLVVAKPNHGSRSNGIIVGTKVEVAKAIAETHVPYLVEEKLDFSAPIRDVKAVNEHEQHRLDEANLQGVNKELRLYYFGQGEWDGVVRVAHQGAVDFRADEWLYIDTDTIPSELIAKGNRIVADLAKNINTADIHIALDWVFASSASHPEPHWQIMEMNTGEPQLVQPSEHYATGTRQHRKLATQIARIAVS